MGCYTDAFPIFLNWSDPSTTHIKLPGDGPVSFISRAELGEAVAHILHEIQTSPSTAEEKFANKTIYLRGPEALTMVDVAKVIGDTIGTEIKVEIVGEEEYLDWFVKNTGRSEFLAKAWGLGTYPLLSKGDAGKVDDGTTERALGRKPVRASEFIRKTLEQNREYKWHQWG